MRARLRQTLLGIALRDSTFALAEARGALMWVGKCLHCDTRLVLSEDGEPMSRATVEHILPKGHGGTDDWPNLGLACATCNNEKGVRHDAKRKGDPDLMALVERLSEKRRLRWREPEEGQDIALRARRPGPG